nr:flavodoxin [[Pseudopropionibacterium] massiliense]
MTTPDKPHVAPTRRTFLTRTALLATAASGALLAACGTTSPSSGGSTAPGGDATTPSPSQSDASARPSAGGSVLVAYYSAQGHTKTVAETIANTLGAGVFVIEPENPFSENDLNWRDTSSRVVTEYENADQRTTRLVANAPDDFARHDTIFVGYPI